MYRASDCPNQLVSVFIIWKLSMDTIMQKRKRAGINAYVATLGAGDTESLGSGVSIKLPAVSTCKCSGKVILHFGRLRV